MIGLPLSRLLRFSISMAIAMLAFYTAVSSHRKQKAEAIVVSQAHQKALQERESVIAELLLAAERHAEQLDTLERQKAGIAAVDVNRKSALETLRRDIAAVNDWAQHALHDDVVRLYARPAFTGAHDYLNKPVRDLDEVLNASDDAAH
jgi:LysB family phage lysis regulatory protein